MRVILLEFNELTSSLMSRFIDEGRLPHFRRLRDESFVFTTEAAEREPYLEPWIQWVTVHSGVDHDGHGVFRLNQGHLSHVPRLWDWLGEAGKRSWICGSMNVTESQSDSYHVIPDPWCTFVRPRPDQFVPFFRFVQQNVLEHTNESALLSTSDYLAFVAFMATHGLSRETVSSIGRQLLAERRSAVRWKRVVLLDLLQFDVFQHHYRAFRPHLATMFLNSTAHYQHAYWDSMEPEAFVTPPRPEERATYENAIRFGYEQMDRLIGRVLAMTTGDTVVMLCTAISQEPWSGHDNEAGGVFYRPKDFEALMKTLGISEGHQVTPVMTHQFYLEFDSAEAAARASTALNGLRVDGKPIMEVTCEGSRVFTGCGVHVELPAGAKVMTTAGELPFFDLFYRMSTGKSARHHPHGILWISARSRRHAVAAGTVPLRSVAPTILTLFGITPPSYMAAPLDIDYGDNRRTDRVPVAV
jgi:hypothetical protein